MGNNYVITSYGVVNKQDTNKDFIREISTKEELEELIERIPYIQTIQAPNTKARKELYDLSMKKYEDVEWVKVVKSVYLRMEDRRYDDFEPGYMEKAKQFLYGEIAVCFQIPFDEAEDFVKDNIKRHLEEFS